MNKNKLIVDEGALVEVTKEFTFDSSHKLMQYLGKCANLHGHTYKLQVTVVGTVNEIGLVLDFKLLKKIVEDKVVNSLDHEYINNVVEYNPTCENMVIDIFNTLKSEIEELNKKSPNFMSLSQVKLYETPTSFAVYSGQKIRRGE